jgi:hypothetical protein
MEKINQDKIEKEAKQILDKFAKALEKVEKEYELNFYVEREEFERIEIASSESKDSENSTFADNSDFKQRILENAPNKDENFIIAEKGGWKT